MADVSKVITGTIPTIMETGLVKHNLKKKKKNLLGLGVDNIVGISLIQATAKAEFPGYYPALKKMESKLKKR
jgi:hypothetical protein